MPQSNVRQDALRARIRGNIAQMSLGADRRWLVSADGSRIYSYDFDDRRQVLLDGGYPYLVAEETDRVVGYGYAGPYRLRPAYRWSVEDSIYIAPDAHRRGIGRALLTQLIDESERRGFRQMIAVIGDTQNVASIELHRALGFRHVGTFAAVGFKHGRWLDSVLMQRSLGVGDAAVP